MENTQFRLCFVHNKHNGEKKQYVGIEYMKLQGIYGYLCVDNDDVKFIYADERGVVMDVLDFFEVIYEDLRF